MANEVKKAVIRLLNEVVSECKTDDEYLKLAGKIVGSKTSKKKLYEKLGLEQPEEVKEPETPEEGGESEDNDNPDAE